MRPSGPDTVPESRPVAACPEVSVVIVMTLKQIKKGNIARWSKRCCRKNFTSIYFVPFSHLVNMVLDETDRSQDRSKLKLCCSKRSDWRKKGLSEVRGNRYASTDL